VLKPIVKALLGVGKKHDEPFEITPRNVLLFAILLCFSFLSIVLSLMAIASLFLKP